MRELLNESEATNIHLHEQLKLLKNEIRRMQRNEERADHLANNEYLKNIILKVSSLLHFFLKYLTSH